MFDPTQSRVRSIDKHELLEHIRQFKHTNKKCKHEGYTPTDVKKIMLDVTERVSDMG
jgi:hypothetical protein